MPDRFHIRPTPSTGAPSPCRGRAGERARRATLVIALAALSACATPSDIQVRHYGSPQFYEQARFHLFTFNPDEPRSLDARIRLARAEIARDPDCRWAGAPKDVIAEATARQGTPFQNTTLAAPVICT